MPRTVSAPQITATNAGSLLTNATVLDNQDRLLDGVTFHPELCLNGSLLELCPTEPVTKTFESGDGTATAPTYGIWVGDRCSSAFDVSVFEETTRRVFAALDRTTSFKTEQALWTGIGTITDNSALASTAADDITGITPSGLVTGIGQMVLALNLALGGGRGLIHVPQWVVPWLSFYGLLIRNGSILQITGTDHNVVAGTGYPGTDPDGNAPGSAETWIYGTGPVNVLLSSIQVVPGEAAQAVDRSVNTIEVRAERGVSAYFNPCAHLALNVCIPDPGPDCVTS